MRTDKVASRVATLSLGHTMNILTGKVIDWGVDPMIAFIALRYVGGAKGFMITWLTLMVVSFIACYATLRAYDWSKTDWLGIEQIKTIKDLEGSKFKRMVAKIVRSGDSLAVIALSILFDPFIVICYMRREVNGYNGLNKRDWTIFLISIVISNGWQTILMYGGLTGIMHLWKTFVL